MLGESEGVCVIGGLEGAADGSKEGEVIGI